MSSTEKDAVVHLPAAPARLLRLKDVQERVAMGKTTIYDWIKAGTFPAPVHLGTMAAWVESEVDSWIQQRIAARDGQVPPVSPVQHKAA